MLENIEAVLKSIETDQRQNLAGQLDLFSVMGDGDAANDYPIPHLAEYPGGELLKMEKEVSGLYLSGHPLDQYRTQIAKVSTCTISQLNGDDARDFDNKTVAILCTVVKNKVMTTKAGSLMAFTTIEDLTGTMELLIFPRVLAECRAYLADNAVIVASGRVSVKEDDGVRLVVEGVIPIEDYNADHTFGENRVQKATPQAAARKVEGLWLSVPSRQSAQMRQVENLLENIFDGPTPVFFKFEDSGQRMRAPQRMWANDHPLLRQELARILGQDHIKEQLAAK